MKKLILTSIPLSLLLLSSVAQADCYYSYKAKRDNPLQLHYGVIKTASDCGEKDPSKEIAQRISRDGWNLLLVGSPIPKSKLDKEQDRAGEYFLKY